MFQLLYYFVHFIRPLLEPICFLCAWGFVLAIAWSFWTAMRDSVNTTQRMHQIPCTGCQFFTGDYRLKCTAQPAIANTEAAIDCLDYQPKTNSSYY